MPLVEAMYFDVPVIAYDSTAIGGTLGGSGILMKEKEPHLVAGMIHRLQSDPALPGAGRKKSADPSAGAGTGTGEEAV